MLKPRVRWLCRRYAWRFENQGDLHTAVKLWTMAIACGDTSPQTQRALGELHPQDWATYEGIASEDLSNLEYFHTFLSNGLPLKSIAVR